MNLGKSVHTALWGSESWEISAHPSDPSVIADGEEKGRRLNEIYPNFPLLFKVINARTRLSVQVHPNGETCKVTGGEPKTEMWCALSDGPIYAGLKPGTNAADVEAAENYLKRCLVRRPEEPATLNNLSIICRKLGRYKESEDYARRALRRLPDSPEVKRTLADILAITEKNGRNQTPGAESADK